MKPAYVITLCAAFFAVVVWAGCDDEADVKRSPSPEERIASIEIGSGSLYDTLVFLPNDSASFSTWVIATDANGLPVVGARLTITVSNPQLGEIQFLNRALLDTTDNSGRVNYRYLGYSREGTQTIYACANSICDHRTFYSIGSYGGFPPLIIYAIPEVLEADSNELVGSQIIVRIVDRNNRGVPNVLPEFSVTGGSLASPPPTDSTGRSRFFWEFYNEFGDFTIRASFQGTFCEEYVRVRNSWNLQPDTMFAYSYWPSGVVYFTCEDTVEWNFEVRVLDRQRNSAPGVPVEIVLSDTTLGQLVYRNGSLQNITDNSGSVRAYLASNGREGVFTVTCCAAGMCDTLRGRLVEVAIPPPIIILGVFPDTLYADSGETVHSRISIRCLDRFYHGIRNLVPTVEVTAGSTAVFSPSDQYGFSEAHWYFDNEFGMHTVTASFTHGMETVVDSAFAVVINRP